MELKGIVYSEGNHYTSHLVDWNMRIWYHDGATTGSRSCTEDGSLNDMDDDAISRRGDVAAVVPKGDSYTPFSGLQHQVKL